MQQHDLDEWSRRLADVVGEAGELANETELREHVHGTVAAALSELYGMSRRSTSAERSPGRGSRLSYDRLYGGVAVEWEHSMGRARREHGAQQALDYLNLLRSDQHAPAAFTAVVADGRQWGFLVTDPDATGQDLFTVYRRRPPVTSCGGTTAPARAGTSWS